MNRRNARDALFGDRESSGRPPRGGGAARPLWPRESFARCTPLQRSASKARTSGRKINREATAAFSLGKSLHAESWSRPLFLSRLDAGLVAGCYDSGLFRDDFHTQKTNLWCHPSADILPTGQSGLSNSPQECPQVGGCWSTLVPPSTCGFFGGRSLAILITSSNVGF